MYTEVSSIEMLRKAIEEKKEFIRINEGFYEIDEPLILDNVNNLKIVGNGNVVISGAKKIMNKSTYPNSLFVNNIRRFKSSAYKVEASAWNRCEREDFIFHKSVEKYDSRDIFSGFLTDHIELYKEKPENIEFVFNVGWTQNMANGKSSEKNGDKVLINLDYNQFKLLQTKNVTRVGAPTELKNLKYALKKATFYHDKNEGKIEYIPTDDEVKNGYEVMYPVAEQLVILKNCKNICFENITFSHTTWEYPSKKGFCEMQSTIYKNLNEGLDSTKREIPVSAVDISYSTEVTFNKCEFSHLGATGIYLGRGCKNSKIIDSKIFDIAGCGIIVGGFEVRDAHPDDEDSINYKTLIENNKIFDIGVLYSGACGILAGYVNSIKIYNNLIYNIAYTGISLGWGWGTIDPIAHLIFNSSVKEPFTKPTILKNNHVKGNEIHHIMTSMHDGAGIYTLSNQDGTIIEDNYIHDNGNNEDEPVKKIYIKKSYLLGVTTKWGKISKRKGYPGGIYLDECSAGITVRNNRIENVACDYYYHDTGVPGIFETNKFDVEPLDNPILSFDE
ncbi:MAG TPA: right-handed parallel beta-helix repeat-containing protein [Clostridia bacterium]|nr:right-handed parallel beta-helix repeat-containing protein [Clostridia bacterium]